MRLSALILCEAANILADGRFNILGGGITQIRASQFPVVGRLTVVARIEVLPTEVGNHRIGLRFANADHHDVVPPVEATANVDSGMRFLNIMLAMENIPFTTPGIYTVRILLDGTDADGAPIEAVLAQN